MIRRLPIGLFILFSAPAIGAQNFEVREHYIKTELMVPMRDGVEIFTQIYEPTDSSKEYPVMLFRTPYGIGFYGDEIQRNTLGPSDLFAPAGYIFVYQDVRGKFGSEGEFEVMNPVYSKLPGGEGRTDETTDTYDAVDWIVENVPNNNGRVGQWGVSYPGWQTVMGMIDAHPAMKASSPQASPADMFIGDDFHHNGAFRLMYTFGWLSSAAATREGQSTSNQGVNFDFGTRDGYEFFLGLGSLANVDRLYFDNRVPTWNEYMEHGAYDEYWQRQDVLQHMKDIRPAVLNVAGWFDAEDFYGPMSIYYEIEKNDAANKSTLVVGPWRHGGWSFGAGRGLGEVDFEEDTSIFYREEVEFPFFEAHLRGDGKSDLPEALVFETGLNEWKSYDTWPPTGAVQQELYLHAGGDLSFERPTDEGFDEFVSDPADPVPFSATPGTAQGHTWMIEDQRFVDGREDVLVYSTGPLKEDVIVSGPILANLRFTTTGTDADWIVKLIDVFPGDTPADSSGFQMLVGGEVFRSKFRNSFEKPEPLVPGEITELEFDLRDKYHRFEKGHRIMVQVQSSWFPVIDRNPQKFVDIFTAEEADFQKATHRVYCSASQPSHLKLNVLPVN